jgi:hypothetical protein
MVRSMGMLDLKEPFIPQKPLRSGQWGSGALGGIFHSGELSAFIRGKIQRVTEPKQAKADHQSSHWASKVGCNCWDSNYICTYLSFIYRQRPLRPRGFSHSILSTPGLHLASRQGSLPHPSLPLLYLFTARWSMSIVSTTKKYWNMSAKSQYSFKPRLTKA